MSAIQEQLRKICQMSSIGNPERPADEHFMRGIKGKGKSRCSPRHQAIYNYLESKNPMKQRRRAKRQSLLQVAIVAQVTADAAKQVEETSSSDPGQGDASTNALLSLAAAASLVETIDGAADEPDQDNQEQGEQMDYEPGSPTAPTNIESNYTAPLLSTGSSDSAQPTTVDNVSSSASNTIVGNVEAHTTDVEPPSTVSSESILDDDSASSITRRHGTDPSIQTGPVQHGSAIKTHVILRQSFATQLIFVVTYGRREAVIVTVTGVFADCADKPVVDPMERCSLVGNNLRRVASTASAADARQETDNYFFQCSCGTHEGTGTQGCMAVHILKEFMKKANSRPQDGTTVTVMQHFHTIWSVATTIDVTLVMLGTRRRADGGFKFMCNGSGQACNSMDAFCEHRRAVYVDYNVQFDDKDQTSGQVQVSKIPIAFVDGEFKGSMVQDMISRDRVIELLLLRPACTNTGASDLPFTLKPSVDFCGWQYKNLHENIYPKICGENLKACNCDCVSLWQKFMVCDKAGVAVVQIEICPQCNTSISKADDAYDLFVCQPPQTTHGIGLAITVCLARAFALGMEDGTCISHMYKDIYNRALDIELYRQCMLQTSCLNYEKFQRAIYACLAKCNILKLLKETRCDCGKDKGRTLICDVVFCGPVENAEAMSKWVVVGTGRGVLVNCLLPFIFLHHRPPTVPTGLSTRHLIPPHRVIDCEGMIDH